MAMTEPPTNTIEEILDKALMIWKQDYPKPDGDNGLLMDEYFERLEQSKVEATQAISTLITQARHNCNATPDDQPNDHHIQYFNQGYKKGRKDTLTDITIWANQEMANDHIKEVQNEQ